MSMMQVLGRGSLRAHKHASYRRALRKCHTNTEISSVPYKTPWKNHREGMILPVFVCMPVFVLPVYLYLYCLFTCICLCLDACLPVLVMRDKISLDIKQH